MIRPRRFLMLAVATGVILAGCGGHSNSSAPSNPTDLISAGQTAISGQSSLEFDVKLGITLHGTLQGAGAAGGLLQGPLTLELKGQSTTGSPEKFDATFDLSFSGGSFTGEILTPDGKTGYIQLPTLLGPGWHKVDLSSGSSAIPTTAPSSGLPSGLKVSNYLKDMKVTSSGGTDTISAALNVAGLVSAISGVAGTRNAGIAKQVGQAIKLAQGSISLDHSSHLPTALDAKLSIAVPASEAGSADGVTGVDLTIQATFTDWGKDFTVQTPPNATPLPSNLFGGSSSATSVL